MKHKRSTFFFVMIALLLVLVIAYVVIELNADADTAPVILPNSDQVTGSPTPADAALYAQITPETVQAVIAAIHRPEGYTRTVSVEDFWGENTSQVTDFTVQVSGQKAKILTLTSAGIKSILVTEDGTWIWYGDDEKNAFHTSSTVGYDGDQWLRSLTYEELLDLPADAITAAGYEEYDGIWCVYASYQTTYFGYDCTVWVSVADGLLRASEIYDDGTLIYRMTGGAVDTAIPDDSFFAPPEAA